MKSKALAHLHEELLHFLLNYRNESKYVEKPNFLFRSTSDIDALREGRWFYDNPKSGWVNIYFTKSSEKHEKYLDVNNLQFGINLSGGWNIAIHLSNREKPFWSELMQSFSLRGKRLQNNKWQKGSAAQGA
ncbi:MAG: hypothetical protein SVR94_14920 [Pseudomonadota bacterium]|nr:hypothetical protein [Pseudomonadota bacterium]